MADTGPVLDAEDPRSPLSIPATRTALLLCDYHVFLLRSLEQRGQNALRTAVSLRDWARKHHVVIVHCLIDLKVDIAPQLKMAALSRIQGIMKTQGPDFPLGEAPDLAPSSDEYVFWRPLGCISVLGSYGLSAFLERHDIGSIVVAGITTSACVTDTVKAASETSRIVTVVEDACTDREPETHQFVMKKLLSQQSHVVTLEELKEAWV